MAFIPVALAALGSAAGATAATATAVGATLAATGVGVLGTAASALAAHNSDEFQAQLQEKQAQQAQDQASAKAGAIAEDNKQKLASARAGMLENGFELTGSNTDLLNQQARTGQLDYLTAAYDGTVQATGLQASAALSKRKAGNDLVSGAFGAGSQALGGLASIYKTQGSSISVAGT